MVRGQTGEPTPSDAELWQAYTGENPTASGEAFILLYTRYRERVRSWLEAAGLSASEAENCIGSAFLRALDEHDARDLPLRARLEEATHAVATDKSWSPAP